MRDYETIFILGPSMTEEAVEKVSLKMQEVVTGNGGEIVKVEKWGKRKLAYPVNKHKKGEYILFQYMGGPVTVSELERNFKMTDAVIKYMTIKVEKDQLAPPVVAAPAAPEGETTEAATAGEAAAPEAPASETAEA